MAKRPWNIFFWFGSGKWEVEEWFYTQEQIENAYHWLLDYSWEVDNYFDLTLTIWTQSWWTWSSQRSAWANMGDWVYIGIWTGQADRACRVDYSTLNLTIWTASWWTWSNQRSAWANMWDWVYIGIWLAQADRAGRVNLLSWKSINQTTDNQIKKTWWF